MSNEIDISMFNTDELKLTLFYSLLNKSTHNKNFISSDADLTQYDLALKCIKRGYIDRFNGRVFKSNISGDMMETGLYNRDNGNGVAEQIIRSIRTELGI